MEQEPERINSFECGKASTNNKFKLYFLNAEDLVNQINKLQEFGFDISLKDLEAESSF